MSWTQDRKDALRQMWVEGKSSRQIAETLGDVTRNAVMGMVNRMGLMGNKDHNAKIKSAHGACRPIRLDTDETIQPAAIEPRHDPVPEPTPAPPPEPVVEPLPIIAEQPVIEPQPIVAEQPFDQDDPASIAANDDPPPAEPVRQSKLSSRLLGPLRRALSPEKTRTPVATPALVSPERAESSSPRKQRPDWRMAVAMVEEIVGEKYSPAATGHRTSLVAISAILGGGDPRRILPRDFPEPFVLRTMRSLAEKGIMIAGNTPETWLDPDLGDLNFFIDMLVAEGVMKGPRTSTTPTALTA